MDYFSDFQRKLKENNQVIPVVFSGNYDIRIVPSSFLFQIIKFCSSNLFIGCIIDIFIFAVIFFVFINDIFTRVSDLSHKFE